MDFVWENGIGDVDLTSPFVTATKKRTHSIFDSPSKSGTQTPSLPRPREPASQSFYFNQPSPGKPLPSIPAHVSDRTLWNTPRTPKQIIDFSSGGETPNTPDQNGDSEATPDTGMGMRNKISRMFSSGGNGAKSAMNGKGRRESLFSGLLAGGPGRGEVVKRDHYSAKGEKVIKRRRQKGVNKQALQQVVDEASESEDDGAGKSKRGRKKGSKNSKNTSKENGDSKDEHKAAQSNTVASIFSFIERHPALPHILSYYAQLLLNFFLVFSAIYILYSIWCAIITDVDIEAKKAASETMAEIAVCAQNYRENRCERATRVPAMETVCSNWESCMQRDPKKVARASVSAKTFAMIFNSFVEPISYKTMLFTAILIFGSFILSNFAFGLFRNKATSMAHQHPSFSHDNFMHPPATPQRYPSGGYLDQQGYYTPYATMNQHPSQSQLGLEPAPSGAGLTKGEDATSAIKKLMFR